MQSATTVLDEAKNELLSLMLQRDHETDIGAKPRAQDRAGTIPLSYAQERFWILDQLGGSSTNSVPVFFRLIGHLQVSVLEDAVSELVRRHEILRTRFPAHDGAPEQFIDPPYRFRLNLIDVSLIRERD